MEVRSSSREAKKTALTHSDRWQRARDWAHSFWDFHHPTVLATPRLVLEGGERSTRVCGLQDSLQAPFAAPFTPQKIAQQELGFPTASPNHGLWPSFQRPRVP